MSRKLRILFFAILFIPTAAFSAFGANYVEGQVLLTVANNGIAFSKLSSEEAKTEIGKIAQKLALAGDGKTEVFNEISIARNKIVAIVTSKTKTTEELISVYKAKPEVLSVTPNYIQKINRNGKGGMLHNSKRTLFDAAVWPNDGYFSRQWNLNSDNGTKASYAWSKQKGASSVIVALVDSGLDYTHNDLAENVGYLKRTDTVASDTAKEIRFQHNYIGTVSGSEEFDVYNIREVTETDGLPLSKNYVVNAASPEGREINAAIEVIPDCVGHGTAVSGVIGAVGNNDIGVAGVNWNVKMVSFSCTDVIYAENNLEGYKATPIMVNLFDDKAMIAALNEVVAQKNAGLNIRVVNLSLGKWYDEAKGKEDIMYQAFKAVSDKGIIICASAGNEAENIETDSQYVYPARFKDIDPSLNLIIVGATEESGNYADLYSNYSNKYVDIAAPGTGIYTTSPRYFFLSDIRKDDIGFYYASWMDYGSLIYCITSGTSMAAPHVTGAVALLCAEYPAKNAKEIIQLIYGSATAKCLDKTKYGVLNIAKAIGADEKEEKKKDSESENGGGCNAGFGALLLLVAVPICFRKNNY